MRICDKEKEKNITRIVTVMVHDGCRVGKLGIREKNDVWKDLLFTHTVSKLIKMMVVVRAHNITIYFAISVA